VTIALTAAKLIVGVASSSVGVLSEAIHSGLDLVSAAVAFFTIREAGKPADEDHPYGHGKIETLSSLLESVLLTLAAVFIVYEGVEHLRNPHAITHEGWAIAVISVSLVASLFAYRQNIAVAKETESAAIEVNALHFLSDVVASAGVLVGLVAMKFTGWLWIDPFIAFAVAAYILVVSVRQIWGALQELTDTMLPEEELARIQSLLGEFSTRVLTVHDLRTRKVGAVRHVDFHVNMCGWMTVRDSHDVCDAMETRIQEEFQNAHVTIHVEPCERTGCKDLCELRPRS